MYCIISLPRTASTFTWHQVHGGLTFLNPAYATGQIPNSIFNPRYNTKEEIERKYQKTITTSPLPLIKIISNHSWDMVEDILHTQYKTIFIKPKDVRRYVLKNVVAKQTDSYGDKKARNPYVGQLVITEEEIKQRLEFYQKHMEYESRCSYSFYDLDILSNPRSVNDALGLPVVQNKYKYQRPSFSDEEMLNDVNDFNQLFKDVYERQR